MSSTALAYFTYTLSAFEKSKIKISDINKTITVKRSFREGTGETISKVCKDGVTRNFRAFVVPITYEEVHYLDSVLPTCLDLKMASWRL